MPNFAKIGATSRPCGAKNLILGPWVIAIPPVKCNLSCILTYPTYNWRPRRGWPCSNIAVIFGNRKRFPGRLYDPTFSRFDTIPACDKTHTHTDTRRQRSDSIAQRIDNNAVLQVPKKSTANRTNGVGALSVVRSEELSLWRTRRQPSHLCDYAIRTATHNCKPQKWNGRSSTTSSTRHWSPVCCRLAVVLVSRCNYNTSYRPNGCFWRLRVHKKETSIFYD